MESFWNKNFENKKQFPEINKDMEVSVCIIGGGITGLSTGYYLSKETDIVILEKARICSSTSGANTGKLTSQHGLFYNYLINLNGKEFAKKYFEANENAINNIEEIINIENIKCDFKRENSFVFTRSGKYSEEINSEKKAVDKILKDKSNVVKQINVPIEIDSAIEFENQAKFNPVKYCYGLADCIITNGGNIFENSIATDIKSVGDKYEIRVNDYKITAKNIVLATRFPTINIPGYYFLKMYQSSSYSLVADVKDTIFDGMYISTDMPIISFRTIEQDAKKLLLAVGYDYKTGEQQTTDGAEILEKLIKKMYPNAEFIHRWNAEDCISLDKIAYIGEYSNLMKNVYIATGFNKWGLTTSNIAANIIKDKILGRKNEYEEIYKSTRLEPIKNIEEVKNMLKETTKSLILSKFRLSKDKLEEVQKGEGKIVEIDNQKVGIYKNEEGEIFAVKPVCTHLGCELSFNNVQKIWECPCHGSKFNYEGKAIEVPGIKNLEKIKIEIDKIL